MKIKFFVREQLQAYLDRRRWSKLEHGRKYPVFKHERNDEWSIRVWVYLPGLFGVRTECIVIPERLFNQLGVAELPDHTGEKTL